MKKTALSHAVHNGVALGFARAEASLRIKDAEHAKAAREAVKHLPPKSACLDARDLDRLIVGDWPTIIRNAIRKALRK